MRKLARNSLVTVSLKSRLDDREHRVHAKLLALLPQLQTLLRELGGACGPATQRHGDSRPGCETVTEVTQHP